MTFHDTVTDLLASMETADPDQAVTVEDLTSASAEESVSILLADIADSERLRSSMPKPPDWYGPIEQVSLQVASSAELLMDHMDSILTEVEGHSTHPYGCRCYELLDLLHDRMNPALADYSDLSNAIEQLRQHRRSHPRVEDQSN